MNLPGHSSLLQLTVTFEPPVHFFPPCCSSTFGILLFVRRPPPQDLSHSPSCHASHSQSTKIQNNFINPNCMQDQFCFRRGLGYSFTMLKFLTRAWVRVTSFNLSGLSSATSTVCFIYRLCTCVRSGSSSTRFRTFPFYPVVPFTMN